MASLPTLGEIHAPESWRCVEFISDVHLQPSEPETFAIWENYLLHSQANAIFILGDLFEAWIGDDCTVPNSFEAACVDALHTVGTQRALYIMHGNRDFLMGASFMQQCGAALLADPTVLCFGGQRYLLSHGDALCLNDETYIAVRAQMRDPRMQQALLAKPLLERQAIAQQMRQQSKAHQRAQLMHADLDPAATAQWLDAANAKIMIHGHTHKPDTHDLGNGLQRVVLSDWDANATPARAQALRLDLSGLHRIAMAVSGG